MTRAANQHENNNGEIIANGLTAEQTGAVLPGIARTKEQVHEENAITKVGIRDRIRHFTWAWFTSTMSTGGLGIALAKTPHKFRGLYTIGVILMIFDIVLFLFLCGMMTARLIIDPQRFKRSFVHPSESFFFGSFLLSIVVILGNVQMYGLTLGPGNSWLVSAINALYWTYAGIALINGVLQFWVFMARTPIRPVPVNPSWFLPCYSVMLTGTLSALIAESQPPEWRASVIVSGVAFQGFGFTLGFILFSMFLNKLFESGLPPPDMRPGMFIPLGTFAYTIIAVIGQANAIPKDYGYWATHPVSVEVLQTVALFFGIFLWLPSFWIFAIATVSCAVSIGKMGFKLPWWAFIFPNVGFTVGTIMIGTELGSEGILWVGSVMTVLLVAIWLFTAGACIWGVYKKRIMWPGQDEDKDL